MPFEILFEDKDLIIVNKPNGWFVHSSAFDRRAEQILMPVLRDFLGSFVYPAHRIDRKTSGIVIFSKNQETHIRMRSIFEQQDVTKIYLAIVRGYITFPLSINYTLTNDNGKIQEALTEVFPIDHAEISLPFGKHNTSRYSLVAAKPITGRQHQIRKHLKHIFHPILGDRPHGCNKQNRFMLEQFGLTEMLLHAHKISFTHPHTLKTTEITCLPPTKFIQMANNLQLRLDKIDQVEFQQNIDPKYLQNDHG